MFVTKSQLYIFLACVSFGGVVGLVHNFSFALKLLFKYKIVKIAIDVLFSIPIGFAFAEYCFAMNFPSLRAYMLVGVFVGLYLYFKSFYILLAKLTQKLYNICKEKILKARNVRKSKRKNTNNRRKGKKVNSRKYGRGGIAYGDTFNGDGLSVNIHRS